MISVPGSEVAEEAVLAVSDGQVLVLGAGRDDLNQAADLGLRVQGH